MRFVRLLFEGCTKLRCIGNQEIRVELSVYIKKTCTNSVLSSQILLYPRMIILHKSFSTLLIHLLLGFRLTPLRAGCYNNTFLGIL